MCEEFFPSFLSFSVRRVIFFLSLVSFFFVVFAAACTPVAHFFSRFSVTRRVGIIVIWAGNCLDSGEHGPSDPKGASKKSFFLNPHTGMFSFSGISWDGI